MSKSEPRPGGIAKADVVALPQFAEVGQGTLGVAEGGAAVPFTIARAFYVYDLAAGLVRGGHAHRRTQQFVICLAGALEASLWDQDGRRTIVLDTPASGLYLRPMTWLSLAIRASGTVYLVLTSEVYDAADYIRDADEFARLIAADQSASG